MSNTNVVEVKNVSKHYSNGEINFQALKGIDLEITKEEFTSIMGTSGSGKSTFMNILGCLDKMNDGHYFLNGKDISKMNDEQLAAIRNKEIGFVFQSFNLLPRMTILENVELPMVYGGVSKKDRRERAIKALEKVGLGDRLHHKPTEISGGQKQRVAIARAIVNQPSIIMADEPTGNLDSKSTFDIIKIFQQLNEDGATIIMVTHEPDVAQHTKRIVRFKDGEVVEDKSVENRIKL
ncbi:MAG: ABC transporter ATP-binding protein [Clostridiaceae bacterium]